MATAQSVKIDSDTVKRVKRHVIDSGQTISEFIEDVLSKKLDTIEKRKLRWLSSNVITQPKD